MTQNDDAVKSSLWKTVGILATLLVAVVTFALTNFSLSGQNTIMKERISVLDTRVSVNDERVLRMAQDIVEIKEAQKEMLVLMRRADIMKPSVK